MSTCRAWDMSNSIVDRIERICDESRRAPGEITFWFTQDRISDDDLLQVFTDVGLNEEYGFMIKSHLGGHYICFCVHKFEKRFLGLLHPHVMKSRVAGIVPIDIGNVTDTDIQEWFEYVSHKFKKKYRPRHIKGK